ncbi:unnamed protein product [Rotaria magnacalcarata]|uniref:Uncharacterized protein n=1 Tax=Rotaria magnacalcarata TaxID=392030 RepID=A0A816W244_9BILA|nr:unnamed protein product [Rotaria magnacalcarata]CAF2134955.1 unnamed protein product [Rotaria magnacalcarata]
MIKVLHHFITGKLSNIMNQDRNPYGPSIEGQQPYPPQQPGGFPPYPPQQPGGFPPYPPQQPGGFSPYPPQQGGGFGQNNMPFQPPPMLPRPNFPKNDEQGGGEWGSFNGLESKEIRRVFIRKVYSILMIQLAVTFGIIAIFHFTPSVRHYVRSTNGQWLYFASYAVFLVTYLVLICSKRIARKYPLNLVLLGLLTISMGYMMGMISAYYNIASILIAVGITTGVCLGVTLFSFQTKFDFTSCMGVIFVMSLGLFIFGIVCIFTYSKILYTVYAGLGAIAFSIFLAVDTQLIMGGKRHEISAEDHICASIMLYIDIVYIFLYILTLFGSRE